MNIASTPISTLVFMDLEATGLPSTEYKIKATELALIAVTRDQFLTCEVPRVQDKLRLCFNPRRTIGNVVYQLTGLCNENLFKHKPFDDASADLILLFLQRLDPPICLIAHNGTKFDFCLLQTEMNKIGKTFPSNLLCADSFTAFQTLSAVGMISNNSEKKGKPLSPELLPSSSTKGFSPKQKETNNTSEITEVKLYIKKCQNSHSSRLEPNEIHENVFNGKNKELEEEERNEDQQTNCNSELKHAQDKSTEDIIVISDDEVEEIYMTESSGVSTDLTMNHKIENYNNVETMKNGKKKINESHEDVFEIIDCQNICDFQSDNVFCDNLQHQEKSVDKSFDSEIELYLTKDMNFLENYTQTLEFQQSEQLATPPRKSHCENWKKSSPSKRSKFGDIDNKGRKLGFCSQHCEASPEASPKQSTIGSSVKKCLDFEVKKEKFCQKTDNALTSVNVRNHSQLNEKQDASAKASVSPLSKRFVNFSLRTLHKTLIGHYPVSSHSAEDDSYSLLRICQAINDQFIEWIDANAVPIKDYKTLW